MRNARSARVNTLGLHGRGADTRGVRRRDWRDQRPVGASVVGRRQVASAFQPGARLPMNPFSILLVGLAMSTDAFAAAIGKGAAMQRPQLREALRAGLIFGAIEAITPLLGWLLGSAASRHITAWDHWIAFGVLGLLGLHMIWNGLKPETADAESGAPPRHGFWNLAATGLGTRIDARAVGVSLAFLDAPILVVAAAIGLCTLVMVTLGIMLGRVLGTLAGKRAEILGGAIMIVVGAAILYEHLTGAA